MRRHQVIWMVGLGLMVGGPVRAAGPVIDDVNDGFLPGNFIFDPAIENLGWFYEPGFDYMLDGVTSTFRAIGAPPVATRDVTLSVYDDVPDNGGILLRSGMFSAGAAGGNLGVTFAALQVEAGEDYFIAFSGVQGLGLNLVDFAVSLPPPDHDPNPAVDFLSGWYTGNNFETFIPHTFDVPAGFAAPILRFHGVIPEPATTLLSLLSLTVVGVARRRRR